jgi:hypothetical protein
MVLALDHSPVVMAPALEVAASFSLDEDKIVEACRSGEGPGSTISAIRSARSRAAARHSSLTARCCWWNLTRATGWRRT